MAFETGGAASHEDFINKLSTFATSNGWTQDEHDTGDDEFAFHLTGSNLYISMRYDNTGAMSIHQALDFTPGNTPGNHPDDSGNGDKTGAITVQRRWNAIGAGPFISYNFFTDGSTYLYVVLEYASGLYRHMIFGEMIKEGTWTGGEFCAGHVWTQGTSEDDPTFVNHHLLFDSRSAVVGDGGTIHIEGLPGEPSASTKWGVMYSGVAAGVDSASVAREILHGGIRNSYQHRAWGHHRSNPANGNTFLIPIEIYRRTNAPIPDELMPLGTLPDIRAVNIHFFNPGQEFTQDGETWKTFPWVRKRFLQDNQEESWNMGIAYKKIV